jgi:NADPH:quinone reductase-like Zn-dependent oxidoreductase
VLEAADLVPVPPTVDPAEAETVVANGITAWQMPHRFAKVRAGGTILVHGANGGVGSTLVQLARHAGITVIGTASPRHHDKAAALGATPIDYRGNIPALVRALAPHGVDAVFDHVGGPGITDSFALLAKGGTLVSYGSASTRDDGGSKQLPVLKSSSPGSSGGTTRPTAATRTSSPSGRASATRRRSAPSRPKTSARSWPCWPTAP